MDKQFIYLICPVNNASPSEKAFLDDYVSAIESQGHKVHYPPRDVNQVDPTGTRILAEHREAMRKATHVHACWSPTTKGSYFDFGMAYIAERPLYIANFADLMAVNFEVFDKFVLKRSDNLHFWPSEELHALEDWAESRREEIKATPLIEYKVQDLDKKFFFDFGMAFYTGKPIVLANREEVEKLAVPGKKSFQNVLLELDARFRTGKR